jgi:ArsR family transcriptional regulator, virulence genes transcriptional regulator
MQNAELGRLEERAAEVASTLGVLANDKRLMILCELVERGECNVGSLSEAVGLSQSALSQHLAKLREDGIVAPRREAQTIWYRIADDRVERLLSVLHELYCRPKRKK